MPPERPVREVVPVCVKRISEPDGERPYLYDFGENLTGWCRLQLRDAAPGTRIRLEFAEKINPDGTLFRTPVGNEINGTVQADYYTAKGGAQETWEPSFTFHGFQYAALYVESGALPEAPSGETLTAVVVHTDLPETASFDCSDPQLVRLHRAAGRTLLAGHARASDGLSGARTLRLARRRTCHRPTPLTVTTPHRSCTNTPATSKPEAAAPPTNRASVPFTAQPSANPNQRACPT